MNTNIAILISGKQGSGKTTTALALSKALNQKKNHEARVLKFASTLYLMHDAVRYILEKNIKVPCVNNYLKSIKIDATLMQLLGTDWARQTIYSGIWVDISRNETLNYFNYHRPARNYHRVAIFDDVRFMNEFNIDLPHKINVRLVCDQKTRKSRAEKWRDNETHPSETDLDVYEDLGKFDIMLETSRFTTDEIVLDIMNYYHNMRSKMGG